MAVQRKLELCCQETRVRLQEPIRRGVFRQYLEARQCQEVPDGGSQTQDRVPFVKKKKSFLKQKTLQNQKKEGKRPTVKAQTITAASEIMRRLKDSCHCTMKIGVQSLQRAEGKAGRFSFLIRQPGINGNRMRAQCRVEKAEFAQSLCRVCGTVVKTFG